MADNYTALKSSQKKRYISKETFNSLDLSQIPVGSEYEVVNPIEKGDLSADINNALNKAEKSISEPTNQTTGSDGDVLVKKGGGSEWKSVSVPSVVQSTGQSTTDVMSQKAVTDTFATKGEIPTVINYSAGNHVTIGSDHKINAVWPTASDSGYAGIDKTGTITGITMNGVSKGTSGVVDLGTVITAHQSLANCAKLDGNNTFTGTNKFSKNVEIGGNDELVNLRVMSNLSGGESSPWTRYKHDSLEYSPGGATTAYSLSYPSKSGTIALTSDIPTVTTYSAGNHVTIGSDNKINAIWPTVSDTGYAGINSLGTIMGINMNGESKGTSGTVDLGTVITSVDLYASVNEGQAGNVAGTNPYLVLKKNNEYSNIQLVGGGGTTVTAGPDGKIFINGGITESSVTTTGSGNAITSATVSNSVITFNKDTTFLTSHQSLADCAKLSGANTFAKLNTFNGGVQIPNGGAFNIGTKTASTPWIGITSKENVIATLTHSANVTGKSGTISDTIGYIATGSFTPTGTNVRNINITAIGAVGTPTAKYNGTNITWKVYTQTASASVYGTVTYVSDDTVTSPAFVSHIQGAAGEEMYALLPPDKSGTIALASDIPDVNGKANLEGGNEFDGTQKFNGKVNIISNDGLYVSGPTQVYDLSVTTAKIKYPFTDSITYEYSLPKGSGTFALTSDVKTYYKHNLIISQGTTESNRVSIYCQIISTNSTKITNLSTLQNILSTRDFIPAAGTCYAWSDTDTITVSGINRDGAIAHAMRGKYSDKLDYEASWISINNRKAITWNDDVTTL